MNTRGTGSASPSWREWCVATGGASLPRVPSERGRRSRSPYRPGRGEPMDDRRTAEVLLVEDDSNDVAVAMRAFHRHSLRERVRVLRDGVELLEYLFDTGGCAGRPPKRSEEHTSELQSLR